MGKAAGLLLCLAACSTWAKMPVEESIPLLHELGTASDQLSNHVGAVELEEGHAIGFRHTRAGTTRRTIVLVHGVLSNRGAWRYVSGGLGQHHDLLMVDLLGCGESSKPDADDLPPDAYSPTRLAGYVLQVMRKRIPKGRIVVVGHSLGGMVTLRMLGSPELKEQYGDVLARVDRAVLISTLAFGIHAKLPQFERIAKTGGFVVSAAATFGILRELIAVAVREGSYAPNQMPREEALRVYNAFRMGATRRAAQAMLFQAIPFTEEEKPDWPAIRKLEKDYANVRVPTLVIQGEQDPNFDQGVAYKLYVRLPNAWLRVLPDRMHQLPSEAPVMLIREIAAFARSGGRDLERVRD